MRRLRRSRRRAPGIRGWLVLAALLGLFAMHGLSVHGSSTRAVASTEVSAGHAGHQSATGTPADPAVEHGAGDRDPGHHHLALMGLCLAVLAGAVAAYSLLRRRPHRGWTPEVTALVGLVAAPAARRFRDPPCLFRLSVQRC